jgi:hypothetical protein
MALIVRPNAASDSALDQPRGELPASVVNALLLTLSMRCGQIACLQPLECRGGPAMSNTADTAQVIVRPPLVWALAVITGFALNWLMPLPFVPAAVPAGWLGGAVFVLALALFAWAITTITRTGSNVPTNMPTTSIVASLHEWSPKRSPLE